jgi:hypothetical protein
MTSLSKTQPAFYVGRESFEMRVSAHNMPLERGTDPAYDALTRAPTAPHPTLQREAEKSEPTVKLAVPTLIGLLLTAFACGIMATIAVDHAFPQDDAPTVVSAQR